MGKGKKQRKGLNVDSDSEGESKTEEISKPSESKKSKGKKEDKSFALLQIEDDEQNDADSPDVDDDDNDTKPVKKAAAKEKAAEQAGKKGKKGRRKRDDSDEDIEKVLAELELEYSGGKPPAKNDTETKAPAAEEKTLERGASQDGEEGGKTATQKKSEKKEKQKQKKSNVKVEQNKEPKEPQETTVDTAPEIKEDINDANENNAEEKDTKKKKNKKNKEKEDKDAKDAKKGPGKRTIAAMQEALKKIKEEEERAEREEEERIRREEEAEQARLEALRLEQEKKDRKKQKEKERKERLKAEGKLLTAKQKADRARAQALIDSLKAQGVELPDVGERKARPGTRIKPKKSATKEQEETPTPQVVAEAAPPDEAPSKEEETPPPPAKIAPAEEAKKDEEEEEEGEVKDTWDASSDEEESQVGPAADKGTKAEPKKEPAVEEEEISEGESNEDSDESDSEDSEDGSEEGKSNVDKTREKALERIKKRKEEAEKNRTTDSLRAAIVCVLGHVDTGKTKILDKLRRTNVQDGEAGGITQQIGATNVPIDAIKEQIKYVKEVGNMEMKVPGLLIIDTPGHESFSNLRNRGSSLCDIAILVVDIMHGLEPQTIESMNLLKTKKCPFVVALNKIDRLYDWQTMGRKDIRDVFKAQAQNTQLEFEQRTKEVMLQFAEQGFNAALFYENPDPREYISLVPTSAITGEGMGNLLALIVDFCQSRLPRRLMYSKELQATVLEVKAIPGLGTTIDVILVNGSLREGDTMLIAGTDGPIVTQIRSLLMPQPMKELRVKNAYIEYKEVKAAQGVKIAAKELEKAIAGLNLYVAEKPDEVDILKEEVARELKSALSGIKLQERGVYVQASTLGSLEALLEFLRVSKIPYSGIKIGPVVKKDVMKASIMLEHESQYATILAFDVKVERDAQELADSVGVKIFQADIIYHLFDKFMAYREELRQKKREEFKHVAVFPCKLRVLPQFVFNSRDPIVCGVMVEAGIVKEGTPVCVPSKEFVDLGVVSGIESNHKSVETARKGMEVCIKIEPVPGEAPKMFGRHFDETDLIVSKISRQSIDACKDYFRDDLVKTDWQLMVELKKLFQIL